MNEGNVMSNPRVDTARNGLIAEMSSMLRAYCDAQYQNDSPDLGGVVKNIYQNLFPVRLDPKNDLDGVGMHMSMMSEATRLASAAKEQILANNMTELEKISGDCERHGKAFQARAGVKSSVSSSEGAFHQDLNRAESVTAKLRQAQGASSQPTPQVQEPVADPVPQQYQQEEVDQDTLSERGAITVDDLPKEFQGETRGEVVKKEGGRSVVTRSSEKSSRPASEGMMDKINRWVNDRRNPSSGPSTPSSRSPR